MESIKVLNLDFRGISNIIQTLKAVQYDDGRAVRVMLSGTQGNISKVRIYCQKPSGMETYTDGTVVNDYCALFGLTPQMLAEEGIVKSQLQLMDGEHVVTSFDFQIQVSKNRIASSSITSSNEYQALVEALKNVDKTEEEISNVKGQVETIERNIFALLEKSLFINVTNFGISPDTNTDISEQLKIIILKYPNKVFYFPKGTYYIEKTIEVNQTIFFYLEDDAEFKGKGDNQFCFKFSNCSFTMSGGHISKGSEEDFESRNLSGEILTSGIFEFTNCNCVVIENLKLKFNSTPNTFKFKDSKNIYIKNCVFSNFLYGAIIFYDACKNVFVKNSIFDHGKRSEQQQYNYPVASGFSTYSSQVGYIENYIVENCFMEDCDWEGCDCHGGKNIRFSNLRMHNCNRFVTAYSDNRPILRDYDFSDVIVENCYFENDDDYVPVSPDASIYCNGRYNRKFRNMIFKNVTVINPVCRDLGKNSYGAFYANYNENVKLENIKFKATKIYDDFQYMMQLLGSRNLKIDGITIEGFPASDVTAPIELKYCTGECENIQVFNNSKQYACIYIAAPSLFKFGKNIGGNVNRPFYTERKYHLQNVGEVIPYVFPYLSPSNMYGTYETTNHKGYGLTLAEGEEQVTKNIIVYNGLSEIQLSEGENYFSVVGTSVTIKVGQKILDTIITDYREGFFTVADIPDFGGTGTVTINRLLRVEIKSL